jgi:hypothetical protein
MRLNRKINSWTTFQSYYTGTSEICWIHCTLLLYFATNRIQGQAVASWGHLYTHYHPVVWSIGHVMYTVRVINILKSKDCKFFNGPYFGTQELSSYSTVQHVLKKYYAICIFFLRK